MKRCTGQGMGKGHRAPKLSEPTLPPDWKLPEHCAGFLWKFHYAGVGMVDEIIPAPLPSLKVGMQRGLKVPQATSPHPQLLSKGHHMNKLRYA